MAELPASPHLNTPAFTRRFVNLAQPRLGASVVSASDEFFAARGRLIDPAPPVFKPDLYDEHGKWMDGWESRRRREPGYDWCLVRLCPGTIRGIEIDTSFFTGNYPPEFSIDACQHYEGDPDPLDDTAWQPLVARTALQGDSQLHVEVNDERVWTHLRFNIYPDGGVARLRVYGVAHRDWSAHDAESELDLASILNGGRALDCNDMHYGHMCNLILPDRSLNMGDGWETRRRRKPGHDWVILRLGHPGRVVRAVVDTQWFKGNYPAECALYGALLTDLKDEEITPGLDAWAEILPRSKLGPDSVHEFQPLREVGTISHVRLDIHPDGGVARLRLFGFRDPKFEPTA
ncbi:MAG: allantoicase [Xanthomonadales bacterium]|nr:allantoicase [Xanthomonadales bacterium]